MTDTTFGTITDKARALAPISALPDATTLDQIAEELAALAAVRVGLADEAAGRVMSHDEARRSFRERTSR